MQNWLLEYICCPACFNSLKPIAFMKSKTGQIKSGMLICQNAPCKSWYPIHLNIPRLLHLDLREKLTQDFIKENKKYLKELDLGINDAHVIDDALINLKINTIKNFGFEWTEYARFGWDDEKYDIDFEEHVFKKKSLMSKHDLSGSVVLDAGCGNGRYVYWASKTAKKVIGIDLGDAVESAFNNTKEVKNIAIIQADIFRLPFPKKTFDAIYSIGVLMHTGNAMKATESLSQTLNNSGKISVHLYGKGNFIYEYIDKRIRLKTTELSITELQNFTDRFFSIFKVLKFFRINKIVNWFIRIDPHPHCIFDWYSAPIATHHTYPEVSQWLENFGLEIVATNEYKNPSFVRKFLLKLGAPTVTVKGMKHDN